MALDFNTPPTDITGGDTPTTNTGGGGGGTFNWSDFLPPGLGGTGSGASAMAIPALATAYNQYQNADRYTGMAEKYAGQLDPFASQRGGYQTMLSNFLSDPAKYISSMPSYQAALQLGLGAVNRGAMASQGTVPHSDDIAYASQLGSQTFNQMMQQLTPLTGAQFGPGAAASILQTGMMGNIGSRNAALQAMMYPFFSQSSRPGGTTSGAPGGGAPGGGAPTGGGSPPPGGLSPGDWFNIGNTPAGDTGTTQQPWQDFLPGNDGSGGGVWDNPFGYTPGV